MNWGKNGQTRSKILAGMAATLLLLSQFLWMLPAFTYAETAGDVLVVRVQYYGEIGSKVREKARFTRKQLEAMGSRTYYYSNITRVGTVMSMAAHGPEVMTIIKQARIDPESIKNVTFRTTDGYTRNFTVKNHLTAKKYYYPNLASCYERNDAGNALTPLEGATEDREIVPAILALQFGESKEPGIHAEDLQMDVKKTYRFCMGQGDLKEGKMTNPSDGGGDITSMESCHSIYGIDITLAGSPIRGMSLDLDDPNIEVGSYKQISVHLDVDELFADEFTADDLTWISSDPSIAEVDSDGEVTVHRQGTVTITAVAPDGTKASITINGVGDDEEEEEEEPYEEPERDNSRSSNQRSSKTAEDAKTAENTDINETEQTAKAVSIKYHEIVLGDVVVDEAAPTEEFRNKISEDAQALDEARTYSPAAAAGTAAGAGSLCLAGAISRIIRYRKNF
ncbi:MAG: Ig-like domain-containing protein [Mogibacterium sp.]|nr:Ig-like domain-containing protein [Mogibacterium sp.]